MHAALSEDLAQYKKARWLTPAIFAILRVTLPVFCNKIQEFTPNCIKSRMLVAQ